MNAERIRDLADSFDPMKAIRWTPWQALVWVIHRDVNKVRECTEIWKHIGPRFAVKGATLGPFRAIWEEVSAPPGLRRVDFNDEVKGWHELQRALESGRVKSSGTDVATGSKREISQLEWEDLRFANPRVIEDGGYQYVHAEPQLYWGKDMAEPWRHPAPAFWDVRVLVADVLQAFPAKQTGQAIEKPGGAPQKYDWASAEDRLAKECGLLEGIPRYGHPDPEWRTKAHAYELVRKHLDLEGTGGPADTTLKEKVGPMLERIDSRMKKVGN
jgi:hypothetical protein